MTSQLTDKLNGIHTTETGAERIPHRNRGEQAGQSGRPPLDRQTDGRTFLEYYYLKKELTAFCRENQLPASGSKQELTDRIAFFLETGIVGKPAAKRPCTHSKKLPEITGESIIEERFVCTETHRAFFKKEIGSTFSFNVPFQKWLKTHAGKTYRDAVAAYRDILEEKKKNRPDIGKQFEYNTYIRDFFADNAGKTLQDAIRCWQYKKSRRGHHRYERSDLKALE